MEIDALMTLISNYAFPIAMCVWLMISNQKASDKHAEEMSKVIEALNNNTRMIESLQDKIKWLVARGDDVK